MPLPRREGLIARGRGAVRTRLNHPLPKELLMPRIRASLSMLSAIVVAAAAALVIIGQSTASTAVTCDTTFTAAVSSSWYVAGNWSNGAPTATSVACLGGN